MALEALDNHNPRMPVGCTTCSKCNRIILTEHADTAGACVGCAEVPTPAAPVDEPVQSAEDLMRDTYPATEYNHDEGD